VLADLDQPDSLQRIAGLAEIIVHLAPPATLQADKWGTGDRRDTRTRWPACRACPRPESTTAHRVYKYQGVYGDCSGELVDETRALPRHCPRPPPVDAERQLRAFGRRGVVVSILRVPGIYAADRLPIERLRRGVAGAARTADDVYTNHIHAEDLAMMTCAALRYGRSNRTYNATDDSQIRMGDYFDLVADRFGLPRVPRLSRREAQEQLSAAATVVHE
jgi:hypothetical protein